MKKYNNENIPKVRYNFTEKSSESIVNNLKSGKLSEDAIDVGFYILKYERQFDKGTLEQIESEINNSIEKNTLNSFGLTINEVNDTLKIEFKKTNKNLKTLLIVVLSISYLLIVLPFSIQRIIEREYLYVFGTLIFFFPFIIFKCSKYFKNESKFYMEINDRYFTIKSISTNYEIFTTEKNNVIDLNIVENGNSELKLMANFKNRNRVEIVSELYSNLDKKNIYEYLSKVKDRITRKLNE